jgi:uncharacterized protein
MTYFAVTTESGPAWDGTRSMREQEQWAEHATFMNALAEERFVVLGGPLGDGTRRLLVIDAESEEAIRLRLAADPWNRMGLLRTVSVEHWEILLGDLEQGVVGEGNESVRRRR